MPRCGDQHQFVLRKYLIVENVTADDAFGETDVDLARDQLVFDGLRVFNLQCQFNARMFGTKRRQHARQHVGADRAAGADRDATARELAQVTQRSEEHTSELQSLMRISYAVFCLKKKKKDRDETIDRLQ